MKREVERVIKKNEIVSVIMFLREFLIKMWTEHNVLIRRGGITLAVFIVLLFLYVSNKNKVNKESLKILSRVQLLYKNGDYDSALMDAKSILNKYSGSKYKGLASLYVGNCYLHIKSYDEAMSYYKKAYSSYLPKWMKSYALEGMGVVYEEKKEYNKAIITYNKVLIKKSEYGFLTPEILLRIANCYKKQGNIKEAANKYQEVIIKYGKTDWAKKAASNLDKLQM